MLARLLPLLLSIWLLAGLGGNGAHVHEHEHGAEPAHFHLVTAFDRDHHQAHADGAIDHDDEKMVSRIQPSADLVLAAAPIDQAIVWMPERIEVDFPQEMLGRGPPPHLRPPSQAPPASFAFA